MNVKTEVLKIFRYMYEMQIQLLNINDVETQLIHYEDSSRMISVYNDNLFDDLNHVMNFLNYSDNIDNF